MTVVIVVITLHRKMNKLETVNKYIEEQQMYR